MRVIDKERSGQRPGDAAASDKPGNRDRNFLKENREECADDSTAERDEQRHPLRRLLHEISGDLKADREAERRDEEPEKFSSKQQDRHADDDADDGEGKVHSVGKSQIPSSKSQAKSEQSKTGKKKNARRIVVWNFTIWDLFGVWDLELGIYFFSIASRFALNSVPGFHSGNLSPFATR